MDINKLLDVIDFKKFTASVVEDLTNGDLLDAIYFAFKPAIIKAIKAAANETR